MIRSRIIKTLALVALMAAPAAGRADFLTSLSGQAVFDPSQGLYSYTYTVTDLPDSTDTLGGLTVDVDPSADVSDLTGPAGWQSSFDAADALVLWVSPDPSTDIPPGSLGTFSFLSPLPPTSQDYLAIGFSDVGIDFGAGSTVGPGAPASTVPEPPGIGPLSLGVLALAAARIRRPKAGGVSNRRGPRRRPWWTGRGRWPAPPRR